MTAFVAWLALALAVGCWIYTLRRRLLRLARLVSLVNPQSEETPTEVLELRRQTLGALAGKEEGWRDNRCARCGHDGADHLSDGCMECPSHRQCVGFIEREPTP